MGRSFGLGGVRRRGEEGVNSRGGSTEVFGEEFFFFPPITPHPQLANTTPPCQPPLFNAPFLLQTKNHTLLPASVPPSTAKPGMFQGELFSQWT